jgi:hypothetical protein
VLESSKWSVSIWFPYKILYALPRPSHPPWFGHPHSKGNWKQNLLGNLIRQNMGHRESYHSMCGHIQSCQSGHRVMLNMLSANGINHTLWFLNVSTVQHRGSLLWSKLLSLFLNVETQVSYIFWKPNSCTLLSGHEETRDCSPMRCWWVTSFFVFLRNVLHMCLSGGLALLSLQGYRQPNAGCWVSSNKQTVGSWPLIFRTRRLQKRDHSFRYSVFL